jgi:hypothetical protein
MLSHFTMSGYTEAQDYLDQAEKHIANFLHPEILQPTREAMAPYKQENDKLKQQVRARSHIITTLGLPRPPFAFTQSFNMPQLLTVTQTASRRICPPRCFREREGNGILG